MFLAKPSGDDCKHSREVKWWFNSFFWLKLMQCSKTSSPRGWLPRITAWWCFHGLIQHSQVPQSDRHVGRFSEKCTLLFACCDSSSSEFFFYHDPKWLQILFCAELQKVWVNPVTSSLERKSQHLRNILKLILFNSFGRHLR